jgi:DNA repair exonuclease SbcCD ATPase subunit
MVEGIKPTDKLVFEVRMPQFERNDEKMETLRAEISKKYGVPLKNVSVKFEPILIDKNGKNISLASEVIDNIQDTNFFLALCGDYMKEKGITDVDFDEIKKINENVEQYIDFDKYAKHKKYRFKYVKWSNYLSYGPDNYFDFTKLHGLVLLNSHPGNQGGKTTFAINLLRFALFGKSPKSPSLNDVFNIYLPDTTEVMVEVCLEIDGSDYVIKRIVTRPSLKKRTDKSKPKQKVEYYKVVGDGELEEIENCEGESTQETNNIIRETIGNPEDFDLVISATKKTLDDLFEKGKTEQGRLFSRWLGLVTIEDKEEIAKDLWKKNVSPTLQSNKYNRGTLELEIKDYQTCNKENEEAIAAGNEKLNNTNEEILKLNEQKVEVLKNRKEIKEELKKLDVATIENSIKSKKNELEIKRADFKEKKGEYNEVKDAVFDEELYKQKNSEIENKTKDKHDIEVKNAEIRVKILTIRSEIERIKKLISEGVCPNCNQKIDVSQQNDTIEKHELEVNRLITNGVSNKKNIESIDVQIGILKEEVNKLEEDRDKVNKLQRLKPTLTAIKANIDTLKLEIEKLESQKSEIETNKDNIAYNNEIDNKIRILDASIKEQTKIKDQHIRDIEGYNNNIKYNNKCIKEREDMINILTEEEKTIRNWTVYQELVGKNGVVKIVLKRALPIINNEIKRTLDGICDFDIVLELNEKNEIEINMINDGMKKPIEVGGSGFETTFAALAVRNALATISSMSSSSILCLDECTSTINPENYDALNELYHRISSNYDFIFDISHNSDLDEIHDMVVTVVKEGHISRIEY